jgi:hypothetical protein
MQIKNAVNNQLSNKYGMMLIIGQGINGIMRLCQKRRLDLDEKD